MDDAEHGAGGPGDTGTPGPGDGIGATPPPPGPPLAGDPVAGPPTHQAPVEGRTAEGSPQPTPHHTLGGDGPPVPTRDRRERKAGRGLALTPALVPLVAVALVSGVTGAALTRAFDDDDGTAATSLTSTADEPETQTPVGGTGASTGSTPDEPLSKAAAAVLPSVVSITAEGQAGTGQGSGVVLSSDGLILTNNHVVVGAGDDSDLSVTLPDGSSSDAELVGRDPATDLAVVRVDADDLTPADLGSSADLSVGDTVLAIGSPLGLDGSVSSGIVSALNRAISLGEARQQQPSPFGGGSSGESTSPVAVIDAIQTDAAINPGNSGGALIDSDGKVVGINTAIASLAQGLNGESGNIGVGFAIPIDDAKDIAEQLVDDGEVSHAYLGVRLGDASETDEGGTGAVVVDVEADGPADMAGLQEGDRRVSIDGDELRDATSVTAAIRSHDPDDEVTIVVERDGDEKSLDVTLGTFPTATD
jgi:putative serine protease PepD